MHGRSLGSITHGTATPILALLLVCSVGCSSNQAGTEGGTGGGGVAGTGGTLAQGGSSAVAGRAAGGQATGGTAGNGATGGSAGAAGGSAGSGATSATGGNATGGGPNGGSSGAVTTGGGAGIGGASPSGGGGMGGATSGAGPGGGSGGTAGSAGTGISGDMPLVYTQENTGADCPQPPTPAFADLTSIAALPDPFKMASGTEITSRADWRCRRAEIAALIQHYELGTKPAPPANLTATYASGKLTIQVTDGGGSITLTEDVSIPSGAGPFPVIIGMDSGGTGSLPSSIFTSRDVATITFHSSDLTPQSPSRGQGNIYKLYPDPKVGSMILWAWGVSRVIDALELTVAQTNIDLSHIAVTGCSYAGKMALYAGAFDERVALTIPEESGGGGEAAWRVSATMTGTEDLEHAQGTSWYYQDLTQFKDADAPKLPFDQHELAAMVAPRALLTIGNPDIDYLATEAGYVSMKAATEVYKALGIPDRIGFSQVGGHSHCAFPSSQTPDVSAFADKFLLGKTSTNTNIAISPYMTDLTKWITFTTPTLN
jgi:hypothetical protein